MLYNIRISQSTVIIMLDTDISLEERMAYAKSRMAEQNPDDFRVFKLQVVWKAGSGRSSSYSNTWAWYSDHETLEDVVAEARNQIIDDTASLSVSAEYNYKSKDPFLSCQYYDVSSFDIIS